MTRLKVTIRAAADDDRSMVYLLAEENLHPLAARAGHPERFDGAQFIAMLDRSEVYVAEAPSAEIAGYIAIADEDDSMAVRCLCVGPAFEAQAVAHQLLEWAEGLAVSRGKVRLDAFVPAGDDPSRHLYAGHGFVPRPEDDRPETIVVEKRLTTS
jgi:GNAT superfamily N-acetyltransferase